MTEQLGRIERPEAERFQGKRKLLLIPLIFGTPEQLQEGQTLLQKYWVQMQSQVESLENRLGQVKRIFHENIAAGEDEGLLRLQAMDERSYRFVQSKCRNKAILEATEDEGTLLEVVDLQRCLMLPLLSNRLTAKLHEWYFDGMNRRYEHIGKRIDESLGKDEVGLLLIGERHQVQFPQDIEVFYVSPPALDEYRRWFQNWLAESQKQPPAPAEGEETGDSE